MVALSLACNSAPVLSAEMDPVTEGPEVRAVVFSLELRWRGLKERLSGACVVFDILC